MAIKKYLSLERLTEYDELIKQEIADGDSSTLSSAKSHTNSEIAKITNGSVVVKEAEHADSSTTAETAGSATKATQDGNSNVITETYETKTDASAKLTEAKEYADSLASGKADTSHTHTIANVTNLQSTLDGKVPTTRKINGKALSADITLTATDIGIDAAGAASSAVATHNTSTTAHSDIRELITGLTTRLNALADSDDTTLDQLSEIVAYIKSNKSLIDSITTSKVNVSDIVDNLTSTASNKPLSAKQGKELKALIDALDAVVDGKANATHTHTIANVTGLQDALDGKAASSHGTHVTYSTTAPVMDGTASVGTASTVARSDHKHPTDTSRASKTEFDTHNSDTTKHITSTERTSWNSAVTKLSGIAEGANKTVVDTALSSTSTNPVQNKVVNKSIEDAVSAISANTQSINAHTQSISALQAEIASWEEITSTEIQKLFNS